MPPRSKPGEGIVVVVDVGPSVRASTETTFFSQAQSCLVKILQRKIFAEKNRDMVGIVLFGTDGTLNNLATSDQYQHITVLQEPKYVNWDMIELASRLPRGSSQGDWLDAIVVAMDLLQDPEGILYDGKKVVLITDFCSDFSDDKSDAIVDALHKMAVELSVIGPNIDEEEDIEDNNGQGPSNGSPAKHHRSVQSSNWNGKPKRPQQLAAECLIRRIVAEVDGLICSFDEAIPQLILFEKKTQGSANWNAMLDIGSHFKIPVTGRLKIKRGTVPSWKKTYIEDNSAVILHETSYHKRDENQSSVPENDVISGYRYGTTLVPFGPEDAALKYTCEVAGATLSVIGFTAASNVPLHLRAGDQVLVVTAKEGDEDGAVALSAIIQSFRELNLVAITRRVYRKNLNPTMGALYPEVTRDHQCLFWVGLPFQEEVRDFTFPSLSKTENKLTNEQRSLMDQFIDDMSLDIESAETEEQLEPSSVLNPSLQHHFNCLTRRALVNSEPLPPPEQHVLDILSVPSEQLGRRDLLAEKFGRLFPNKKIENYKLKKENIFEKAATRDKSTFDNGATSGPLTSAVVTNLNVQKISTATPVEDFYALLKGDLPRYSEICTQMSDVLLQMTESLTGDDSSADRILVTKIQDGMSCFRKEGIAIDPSPYNYFVRQLKPIVQSRSLLTLWSFITQKRLGLISKNETLKSSIGDVEASAFLTTDDEGDEEGDNAQQDQRDYDDMLDDL